MKFIILLLIGGLTLHAQQEDALAKSYFEQGKFDKAIVLYKELLESNPYHYDYNSKAINCYQQLSEHFLAQRLINKQLKKTKDPVYFIDLGYNASLLKNSKKADKNYRLAIEAIQNNPALGGRIGQRFEAYSLNKQAIRAYEYSMSLNPANNYYYQIAGLYGTEQNIEKMFENYLKLLEFNAAYSNTVKRVLRDYVSEDKNSEYNTLLRKLLLRNSQRKPNILWNQILSWLFVQEEEYQKAFVQERALYRRSNGQLKGLVDLALLTKNQGDLELSATIFKFINESTTDPKIKLDSSRLITEIELQLVKEINIEVFKNTYETLLKDYGYSTETIALQLSYARFWTFYAKNPARAIDFLNMAISLSNSLQATGKLKMELADVLLMEEQFNRALVLYAQIQNTLKNTPMAQEARFKSARVSFYKGDFDWAQTQLKVLKSSSSQLIANDALALHLLIADNKYEDSTQTALKWYAKAELSRFKKEPKQALLHLENLLLDHGSESIAAQAIFLKAQIQEDLKEFSLAASNYQRVIEDFENSILADDAYFALANLYSGMEGEIEKAKRLYEYIIFNFQDSIHFVDSQKKYRFLRGDSINSGL